MNVPDVAPAARVWQFWAGPRPVWIDACLRLMAAIHGPRYTLLMPSDLSALGLGEYWGNLDPAQLSDLARFRVLAQYGGAYVDADFVPARPLLLHATVRGIAVSGGSSDAAAAAGKLEPNFVYTSEPNAPLILRVREEQMRCLSLYGRRWGFTASPAFVAAVKSQGGELGASVTSIPWRDFAVVPCDRHQEYYAEPDYRVLSWLRKMHGCMFWNSRMSGLVGSMTLAGIQRSKSLMAAILRACCFHAVANYDAAYADSVLRRIAAAATDKERECWK